MPVRELESFLRMHGLIRTSPLHVLASTRIGVDGRYWFQATATDVKEPLQVAMGGVPLTLSASVKRKIDTFRTLKIDPLVVFSGINPPRNERLLMERGLERSKKREAAWDQYNRQEEKKNPFQSSGVTVSLEVTNSLMNLLGRANVPFFRAPYLASGQLAWFEQHQYVHAVLAGPEMLLFQIQRVIVDMDVTKGVFHWVDAVDVHKTLGLSSDQFLDVCLLAGFEHCPTFPPLTDGAFSFQSAVDVVKEQRTGLSAIQNSLDHQKMLNTGSDYRLGFLKARVLVRHHIILDTNCNCEPLNKEECPMDLYEVFGPKFPNSVYFFLSQGAVSPLLLQVLVSGIFLETAPLVDSIEYRYMVNNDQVLMDLREQSLSIVANSLNNHFRTKPVVIVRWFDKGRGETIRRPEDLPDSFEPWRVSRAAIAAEMQRQQRSHRGVDLSFVVKWHSLPSNNPAHPRNQTVKSHEDAGASLDELVFLVLTAALELSKYLTPVVHNLSPFGVALLQAGDPSEEALLAIELIKTGQLSLAPLTSSVTETSFEYSVPVDPEIILISRVMTLLPMRCRADQPWEGPVDHDLLGFMSIVRPLYRSWRTLLESLVLSSVLAGTTYPRDLGLLLTRIPFLQEPNTALGIVFKAFAQRGSVDGLGTTFACCEDIVGDLRRGSLFWEEVMRIVTNLRHADVLREDFYQEWCNSNLRMQALKALLPQ